MPVSFPFLPHEDKTMDPITQNTATRTKRITFFIIPPGTNFLALGVNGYLLRRKWPIVDPILFGRVRRRLNKKNDYEGFFKLAVASLIVI